MTPGTKFSTTTDPRKVADDRRGLRMREIEGDAILAGVAPNEVRALFVTPVLEPEQAPSHLVAIAGSLDLDHAGAEIGEQPRAVRPGEDRGEVEDHESGQRKRIVAHRRSIAKHAQSIDSAGGRAYSVRRSQGS